MKDEELEGLLRRYEPVAPPASLRARVIGERTNPRRTWPWAAAAAVLVGVILGLHAARGRLSDTWTHERTQERALAIEMVTEMFGGDDAARVMAEQAVARDEAREAIVAMAPVATTGNER